MLSGVQTFNIINIIIHIITCVFYIFVLLYHYSIVSVSNNKRCFNYCSAPHPLTFNDNAKFPERRNINTCPKSSRLRADGVNVMPGGNHRLLLLDHLFAEHRSSNCQLIIFVLKSGAAVVATNGADYLLQQKCQKEIMRLKS